MIFRDKEVLLIAIVLVYVLARASRGTAPTKLLVSSARFWNVHVGKRLSHRLIQAIIWTMGILFLLFALARPQVPHSNIKRTVEGIDIMMVLDLSASMRVEDFRDRNRLEMAKPILKEFIRGRASDRIGFEIFSGEAVTVVPPTLDYELLLNAIDGVEIGDLKDGTAIGDALATAVSRLKESTAKTRVVILVTDGDSNIGQVDPLTAGELAKGFGIKVYSIAMGRDGRVAMPFVTKDFLGRSVKTYQYYESSINPELLKQISALTGGKFYRVEGDEKSFRQVFQEIDRLEKTAVEKTEHVQYEEKFARYAWIGLIALLFFILSEATIFRVFP
ncbi:MAG TPA: VWA domain-containing protein [Oligoflexia bacterium]|nr:VWA domain-containing protein [Oligoflexia bacterium]